MRLILLMAGILLLTGCSNRAAYQNFQINQRHECMRLPPQQFEECMDGLEKSYDEYNRERAEALEEEARERKNRKSPA